MPAISSYALQYRNVSYTELTRSSFDLFITEGAPLPRPGSVPAITDAQVAALIGQGRTVVGYINVGVTDANRGYWNTAWTDNGDDLGNPTGSAPAWLQGQPADAFGRLVKFWDPAWQQIVIDQAVALVNRGYSGIFLDDIGTYYALGEPGGMAQIREYASRMCEFVAAIEQAITAVRPDAYVVANTDPYLVTNVTLDARGTAAAAAFRAAVDAHLLENQSAAAIDYAQTSLSGETLLILESDGSPAYSYADSWQRGILYAAPPGYDGPGIFAYPATEGDDTLFGGDGRNQISGLGGNDWIDGGGGLDALYGGLGNDTLFGGAGDDNLNGGGGVDTADGGPGNDGYEVDHPDDIVIERAGEGNDRIFSFSDYVLAADCSVEFIRAWPGINDMDLTGNDLDNIIHGNGGDNRLLGLGGNDYLYGGDEVVIFPHKEEGSDNWIDGGPGADVMVGGGGDDVFWADQPGDRIIDSGARGFDTLYVGYSFVLTWDVRLEAIYLNAADPFAPLDLTGNEFTQLLVGNDGNNRLDGGVDGTHSPYEILGGSDTLVGLGGDDSYYVSSTMTVREDADDGFDRVYARTSFTLLAGNHVEVLSTADNFGTAAINLGGNELDNIIYGNAGANILDGKGGNDWLEGLGGDDTYYVDSAGDYVREVAGGGNDRILSSIHFALAAGHSIEVLSTDSDSGTGTINLTGNELDNIIYGNAGNNTLTGGAGNDFLFGWLGVNVLVGGLGDDIYHVGYGSDTITENAGEGQDRVLAGSDYTLADGVSIEILSTDFHAGTAPIAFGGNELDNIIFGNAGNNILYGKAGNDQLIGLAGSDSYYVETVGDQVFEAAGEGSDRVFASADYTLYAGQSIEILSTDDNAGTAAINLGGNELDNIIYGNAGANILYGKGGNDWLEGLSGDDGYYVDSAGDYVREVAGGGNDRIFAGGDYTLYAGQSIDILSTDNNFGTASIALGGNELDNVIYGNDGNNILYGKEGNDTLMGLGGNDQFWFNTALGATNVDTVYGFASGGDKLVLFQSVFAGLSSGGLAASAFVTGSAAQDADDRIVYNSATGALLYDADGNGAGAAVQFATLNGAPIISASDVLVF